jgi:3-oxoacyl-[acyl-carrier protein] reductase
MNTIDLQGRCAVVTGGARGIGLAIAGRLLASGARCELWDIDQAALDAAVVTLGSPVATSTAVVDVTDLDAVERAEAAARERLGRIDILVNSAGVTGPSATLWEFEPAAWRRVIEVDLMGVYHCCRAVVPAMRQQGYGRIVSIASIAGKEGNPLQSGYSAAKAGVIGLTKSLGKELATSGVLVHAVAPAIIETELLQQMSQQSMDYSVSKVPMGRMGQADEVAALVAWLCSEDCSFSTGAVHDISGGRATY